MTVQPFPSRYTAVDQGDRLIISLPARRDGLTVVFLGVFLLVWLSVYAIALSAVAADVLRAGLAALWAEMAGAAPIVLLWLSIWTFGGLFNLYILLWQLTGREVIEVNRAGLSLSRRVLGRGRVKTYLAEHIKELRLSPTPFFGSSLSGWRASRQPLSMVGQIAFDYGARTIRFADTDEAEAKMILKEIQKRYSRYRVE